MNTKANILIALGMVAPFLSRRGSLNQSCWRYNVLTDLPDGLRVDRRKKGKSYPHPGNPFDVVALADVLPHDAPKFSQDFSNDFAEMLEHRDELEEHRGHEINQVMQDGEACSIYDLDFPLLLKEIEGLGVFVHANRHKSSYRKPTKAFINEHNERVVLSARQRKKVNLPTRGVHVGLRGKVIDPKDLPKTRKTFVFYSPHVPYWRKLTRADVKKMEKGERIDLKKKPILISADYALLANQPSSRLPYVVVYGGVFRPPL